MTWLKPHAAPSEATSTPISPFRMAPLNWYTPSQPLKPKRGSIRGLSTKYFVIEPVVTIVRLVVKLRSIAADLSSVLDRIPRTSAASEPTSVVATNTLKVIATLAFASELKTLGEVGGSHWDVCASVKSTFVQ